MTTNTSLVRLLQLASPTLPVGAYSYSQGLEAAIDAGVVTDAVSAQQWIGDLLEFSMSRMEAPLLYRMIHDPSDIEALNSLFLANRETAELRAETVQMGYSMNRLLPSLDVDPLAFEGRRSPQHLLPPSMHGRSIRRKRCRPTSGRGSKTR